MSVAVLHRDDVMPSLPVLCGFLVTETRDAAFMARMQSRETKEIEARFAAGDRAYVATLDGHPAAWGWVATRTATIGELGLTFDVPAGERYLWNFVTQPTFRGRGVYPRLLQEIVRQESKDAERFWVVYAPENRASERGIVAAGFQLTAELSFDWAGAVVVQPHSTEGDDPAMFGAPSASGDIMPCWKCARAGRQWLMRCAAGACSCDYQRPQINCHEGTTMMRASAPG